MKSERCIRIERQIRIAVPGEMLGDLGRRPALDDQRDKRHPQCVEVDHAVGSVTHRQNVQVPPLATLVVVLGRADEGRWDKIVEYYGR